MAASPVLAARAQALARSGRLLVAALTLGALAGVACGAASALFLFALGHATSARVRHEQLLWALPVAGAAMGWVWQRYGEPIRGGSSLVIDAIYAQGPPLPWRLAPMVLVGTLWTHLFGGSAGREGTAVQMGAGLADGVARALRVDAPGRRTLLVAGVAGGFGSVFGTPIAGAVFALEVVVAGRVDGRWLVPAIVAALVGDQVTRALGISHGAYPTVAALPLSAAVAGKWLVVALAVAATAVAFLDGVHWLRARCERALPAAHWRMAAAGVVLVASWQLLGTADYMGLGLPLLGRAFFGDVAAEAFALKLAFTVVTLAAGFVGGEVTPLFVIGATLGATLAQPLNLPPELTAGVAMVALFGAAANTPWALTVMAAELFGAHALPHAALVCGLAYVCTGRRSLYGAQRLPPGKLEPREAPSAAGREEKTSGV